MRSIAMLCVALAMGCATTRQMTISARPADANLSVDGVDRGHGPITEKLRFRGDDDVHRVTASRLGYATQSVELKRSEDRKDLTIDLQPRTRAVVIRVSPLPARITVDGRPVADAPAQQASLTLPFTVDASNRWTEHRVQASRPGYEPAEQVIKWNDPSSDYTLALDAMKKDLSITTTPSGAQVSIAGKALGASPITYTDYPFPTDPQTGQWLPQRVRANKPGYEPAEITISWDNGRRDYHLDLAPRSKTVRVSTTPAGAVVTIDGKELSRDASGVSTGKLSFPPVDEKGTPRTYTAVISKKTVESEWVPEELTIGWDNGRADYSAALTEVKSRQVTLLRTRTVRTDDGWKIEPQTLDTLAMKDVTEGPMVEPPVRIMEAPKGAVIDSLAVSPDGQWLLFTILQSKGTADLRSQVQMIKADGTGGPVLFGDGRSLDLTPSFTPDGSQIVFASNRGGKHLSIWEVAANGEGGITQLTSGDTTDLWPTVDSDPKPRLFYEALVDSRPDPRVYMTQLGTTIRTDLTQSGGEQPRVSPKADAVVFTLVNEKTGKREIYKMSDRGGSAINLTNAPDSDNFDPAWSKGGSRIAFVSDRGTDADGKHNNDIWMLDLAHSDKPTRLTTNGSWDDCPAFDPAGKALYFRSNRGGTWGIWRIAVP
jgi:hypothetical protein